MVVRSWEEEGVGPSGKGRSGGDSSSRAVVEDEVDEEAKAVDFVGESATGARYVGAFGSSRITPANPCRTGSVPPPTSFPAPCELAEPLVSVSVDKEVRGRPSCESAVLS